MLIDLANLGIKKGTNGLALDFQKQIFVLKHEVTHQLLGRWSGSLPVWLNEGFAECMAATPSGETTTNPSVAATSSMREEASICAPLPYPPCSRNTTDAGTESS